jgi:hypothetical protein
VIGPCIRRHENFPFFPVVWNQTPSGEFGSRASAVFAELFPVQTVTGMKKPITEDRQRPITRQAVIDDNLKRVYEATLAEDMPDRFKQLLDQLRQKEQGQS